MQTAKSNVLAIIAEYNPFHFGHLYQLNECKKKSKADYVVIIMSGNFTQRGEPAILDKLSRAKMALNAGCDLVLELPFYYACNSAQYFAQGAIDIIENLKFVTHLGFGSEDGDVDRLNKIAEIITDKSEELGLEIKRHMKSGFQYSKALQLALEEISGAIDINPKTLTLPNNVLAIEYIKALKKKRLKIEPISVKRAGIHHDGSEIKDKSIYEHSENLSSGSIIRKKLRNREEKELEQYLPHFSAKIIRENSERLVFADNQTYFDILRSTILSKSEDELKDVFSIGEGLENKIKSEIRYASSLDEFIRSVKSKRYPYTRINRICSQIIVGLKKSDFAPRYTKVLAFNKKGSELLRKIKSEEDSECDIITNVNKEASSLKEQFMTEIKATDIYNLISKKDLYKNSEYVCKPVIF